MANKEDDTQTAEGAVRLYLAFLADPESLRDTSVIKKLELAVATAKDQVDKLKAVSALRKAQSVSGEAYEADFVRFAREWADSEGISAEDFKTLGVSDKVLRDAGLLPAFGKRTKATAGTTKRAPRLSLEEVAAAVPDGEFKISDLATAINRENGTTRTYVLKLVEAGMLKEVGDDPSHSGRGKAAKIYAKL